LRPDARIAYDSRMADIQLTYFDFPGGRGEDCRLCLHIAGVDWKDDRVPRGDWMDRKGKTPFGNLPVLRVDGREIGQSNAILAYLGRRFDLHPSDPWQAARHEAILNVVEELRAKVAATFTIEDEEEKKAARQALSSGYIIAWADNVTKQLGDGPFLAGEAINVADLKLFIAMSWLMNGILDHIPTDVFSGHPALIAHHAAVKSHPKVTDWYAR